MIASDLVRCAVFCALPFAGSPGQIVVLAAVAGFATSFFRPAVYAGLPNLVDERDLPNANSLLQSAENLAVTAGPLLGGVLVAVSGPEPTYWLNAVTFLVSAALVARIPGRLLQTAAALSRGHWRDLAEGFELVRRSRPLLTVLVVWNVVMLTNAGINVAEVVLAKVSLDAGDFGFGLLVAVAGVGLAAGSLFAGGWIDRRGLAGVYAGSIGLMALGFGAAAVSPSVWVAAACVAAAGVGNGAAIVCNALWVQRGAPDHLRGRAFTLLMSSNFAFLGAGMLVAGWLTDQVGARWVWAGGAVLCSVAAVVAAALAPRSGGATAEAERGTPELAAAAEAAGGARERAV
jgi:MFS family permease